MRKFLTTFLMIIAFLNVNTYANDELRGIWIATVNNIDYPINPTKDPNILKEEAIEILDEVEAIGINAVFLQVRPTSDSIYPSEIFPYSKYVTGFQGLVPDDNFDLLDFWVKEAHKRNVELHAWINPYRITLKPTDKYALSGQSPAIIHPEWVLEAQDGNLYYNPGLPDVRQLILDGVMEIVEKYDIDGIHFDDYFYPSSQFDDSKTYEMYSNNMSISDWRRENVNILVENVYKSIKKYNNDVSFGISPFGIWDNKKDNPLGSDTNGLSSYSSHFADSLDWINREIVDYVAPQLYWNIGYEIADYEKLVDWWSKVISDKKVKLYIGHSAYKTNDPSSKSPWYGVDEIRRQLILNELYSNISGDIFYNYSAFKKSSSLRILLKREYTNNIDSKTVEVLVVGRPYNDIVTSSSYYFIGGASDPKKELYLNGEKYEERNSSGYFGGFFKLNIGENIFEFVQGEKKVIRKIKLLEPLQLSTNNFIKYEINQNSAYPNINVGFISQTKITLQIYAPDGSRVVSKFNGISYELESNKKDGSTDLYSKTIQLPKSVEARKNLGYVTYEATKGLNKAMVTSKGYIEIIGLEKSILATINNEYVDSYQTATTSNGGHYILLGGMNDYVIQINGDFLKLLSGIWIKSENATLKYNEKFIPNVIDIKHYSTGVIDEIRMSFKNLPIAYTSLKNGVISLTFNGINFPYKPIVMNSKLVSKIEMNQEQNKLVYEIYLSNSDDLAGYYLGRSDNGISLILKSKKMIVNEKQPLSGMKIMIDPGHGGTDSGSIGLLGIKYTEKNMNMDTANLMKVALEKQGANVFMTRTEDTYFSLNERLLMSRRILPDLFISIHADSYIETSDLNKVKGFSVFYKDELSKGISDLVLKNVVSKLNRKDRGSNYKNLYMVRGTWSEHILFEMGFMSNPEDFEWMNDMGEKQAFVDNVVNSIIEYYKK